MYARVATFESDPTNVDDAIAMIRSQVEGEAPAGLEGAKMLISSTAKVEKVLASRSSTVRKQCATETRLSTR